MSLKIILIMLALSGVGGVVLGYVLRVLIGLAQRGSVELDIKQKLLKRRSRRRRLLPMPSSAGRSSRRSVSRLSKSAKRRSPRARSAWRQEKNFLIPASATWTKRTLRCARANRRRCARRRSQKISQKNAPRNSRRPRIFRKRRRARSSFSEIERTYEESILLRSTEIGRKRS